MPMPRCQHPGCESTTVFRTSPKGEPFEGKCAEHLEHSPDPEVAFIVNILGGTDA